MVEDYESNIKRYVKQDVGTSSQRLASFLDGLHTALGIFFASARQPSTVGAGKQPTGFALQVKNCLYVITFSMTIFFSLLVPLPAFTVAFTSPQSFFIRAFSASVCGSVGVSVGAPTPHLGFLRFPESPKPEEGRVSYLTSIPPSNRIQ